ncbi:PhzF family phenazine biosynthesis protein [Actinomadura sp. HBU206391]|uniref:PhzF family phenazine biosynthesis protein n=1 Tax=Actinomadura sp. HBU206391 TaxID=2731692 RepID=UPI001650D40C|nr:PhzF family phenazine biosynthesis protein [Actinomadura sp. HBU206391]MBC6461551.1 PhzF family phenazine biosynthesis protein [Actinomadura sp. HBU206391]
MRILVVDAFADRPFTGNTAGVCLLGPAAADAAWMQAVAAEMKHSETAFPRPIDGPDADFELRWFTPAVEVALCGHATLAAAHVLYEAGAVPADRTIRFQTLHSGVLTARRDERGWIEMDFPACPAEPAPAPEGLEEMLGVPVGWTGWNAQRDLLVQISGEEAVRGLAPDLDALAGLGGRGIIVTSIADPGHGHDFVSRFFGPAVGVSEDPVTGSAHCALAPYWAERIGRDSLLGYQASPRGGYVQATVRGDRVTLCGPARTVLEGELRV